MAPKPVWVCLFILAILSGTVRGDAPAEVLIVFRSEAEPYRQAVEAIRQGLSAANRSQTLLDLTGRRGAPGLADIANQSRARLIIAVGSEALTATLAAPVETPVLGTMVLRADAPASRSPLPGRQLASTYLDVPLASMVAEIAEIFPGKRRLGIIRNPANGGTAPSLSPPFRQQGFTLDVAECSRPEDLSRAFRSLKGKADLVIVLPDASLYNQSTVKPLVLASLEAGLPIVGFSSSFTMAGAAAGIYPDYHDIGHQTAEAAAAFLAGKRSLVDENPRKLQVAVNQRMFRLLGLAIPDSRGDRLVVYR